MAFFSSSNFYTMSFEHTDVEILHAVSARIYDLHLTRDKPTTVNIHRLPAYMETLILRNISSAKLFNILNTHERNHCRTLHKLHHAALMNIRPRYSTRPRKSTHALASISLQKHSKMSCTGHLLMHDQTCRSMRSLEEITQHLQHGIKNASHSITRA